MWKVANPLGEVVATFESENEALADSVTAVAPPVRGGIAPTTHGRTLGPGSARRIQLSRS